MFSRFGVSRFLRSTRGSAAVEFAIWLTVLVPAVMNIIDLGVFTYNRMQVSNVAQSAVQAAWAHCSTPPTSSCSNFNTYLAAAITNGSALGGAVTETSGARDEGYFCPNNTGTTLTKQGAATPNCASGAPPGYYFKTQVQYTYHPMFRAISVATLLGTTVANVGWTRLS